MDARREPEVERCLSIVASDGFPEISHRQWRYAASILIERQIPCAVLSSHRSTLAIVRATAWNGANIRAFRWAEFDAALEFIGVPAQRRDHMRLVSERLRDGLPISASSPARA
jgi:hypothetical protein